MTIQSGFFNSVNGDRRYDAPWFAEYFATFIGNGVFPNPSTGLQVVEGTNMQTIVKPGKGWINGYYVVNDSDYVLQHDIADGVLKRMDRIVLRLNYLTRQIEIVVKKGTFASTPVAPPLQRDTDAYELVLADVFIGNGITQITQINITDQRLNTALCGIVHGTVSQVDTTTIFNQYQSWINQQKAIYELDLVNWTDEQQAEFEAWQSVQESDFANWKSDAETSFNNWMMQEKTDFEAWYQSLRDLLDENIAATLTTKVTALEVSVQDLTNELDDTSNQIGILSELEIPALNIVQAINGIKSYTLIGASNFNSTLGRVISHSIGHTNYRVMLTPTQNPNGYLGEVWVEKSMNSFVVKCSGTATTSFDYIVFQ